MILELVRVNHDYQSEFKVLTERVKSMKSELGGLRAQVGPFSRCSTATVSGTPISSLEQYKAQHHARTLSNQSDKWDGIESHHDSHSEYEEDMSDFGSFVGDASA